MKIKKFFELFDTPELKYQNEIPLLTGTLKNDILKNQLPFSKKSVDVIQMENKILSKYPILSKSDIFDIKYSTSAFTVTTEVNNVLLGFMCYRDASKQYTSACYVTKLEEINPNLLFNNKDLIQETCYKSPVLGDLLDNFEEDYIPLLKKYGIDIIEDNVELKKSIYN